MANAASTAPAYPSTTFSKSMNNTTTTASAARRPCHVRRRATSSRIRAATSSGRDDTNFNNLLWLPRRDVLAGLTLTGVTAFPGVAFADLPTIYEGCGRGESKVTDDLLGCDVINNLPCPPRKKVEVVNFADLPRPKNVRVRRPAHELTADEVARYKKALAKMKELSPSNPSSFAAQAAIHEAYCDGHYHIDPTEKNRKFDVHFSWIFAPWHRMYIYFYERMVNHYVDGKDAFALPYWSWDVPAGMAMPDMFKDATSPLYDQYRNPDHLDAVVDLDYHLGRKQLPPVTLEMKTSKPEFYEDAVDRNLGTMFCTEANFNINEINKRSGRRLRKEVGELKGDASGSLERMAHTAVHVWAGRPGPPKDVKCTDPEAALGHDRELHCANDMGFLGSAARDPLFYSHHSNVDRLWHLWSTKLKGGKGFDEPEWLNTSFLFYDFVNDDDDTMRLVRVTVRDVLDTAKLGYTYSEPDKTTSGYKDWMDYKPTRRLSAPVTGTATTAAAAAKGGDAKGGEFSLELKVGETVVVPSVTRPARDESGMRPGVEVLVIDSIDFDPGSTTKFDVAINAPKESAEKVGPQYGEYAGSFASVQAAKEKPGDRRVVKLAIPIDDVLADLGVGAGVPVNVVIVPRAGDVKIGKAPKIEIQYC
nr:unnamed protein product [Digitaria exilis]